MPGLPLLTQAERSFGVLKAATSERENHKSVQALDTRLTNTTTGVLSGTAAAGTGGTYNLTFTASNGVGSNVVEHFALTVH